jgi:hypothetical protein
MAAPDLFSLVRDTPKWEQSCTIEENYFAGGYYRTAIFLFGTARYSFLECPLGYGLTLNFPPTQ